jgi:hypothetical protein
MTDALGDAGGSSVCSRTEMPSTRSSNFTVPPSVMIGRV